MINKKKIIGIVLIIFLLIGFLIILLYKKANINNKEAIKIAKFELKDKYNLPENYQTQVKFEDNKIIVTFSWQLPPGVMGADYIDVIINKSTGKVIQILEAPN